MICDVFLWSPGVPRGRSKAFDLYRGRRSPPLRLEGSRRRGGIVRTVNVSCGGSPAAMVEVAEPGFGRDDTWFWGEDAGSGSGRGPASVVQERFRQAGPGSSSSPRVPQRGGPSTRAGARDERYHGFAVDGERGARTLAGRGPGPWY